MNFNADIDIDFPDRKAALALIEHIPASIITEQIRKHNTGIYVTSIPVNLETNSASIDYKVADSRGYFKFDFLNVTLYQRIKSEEHLTNLMNTLPDWTKLYESDFCSKLIHIGNHYDTLLKMSERIDSIYKLAMFLAVIRPGKAHLIGKTWKEIELTIWKKTEDGFSFKMAHAISYSHLVVVNMNLDCELIR